uniref:Uncharacterized protein n=1 Tax=viral metagenome TaxID=1070528 RepID=A0A6C0ACX4_9ZZZZ
MGSSISTDENRYIEIKTDEKYGTNQNEIKFNENLKDEIKIPKLKFSHFPLFIDNLSSLKIERNKQKIKTLGDLVFLVLDIKLLKDKNIYKGTPYNLFLQCDIKNISFKFKIYLKYEGNNKEVYLNINNSKDNIINIFVKIMEDFFDSKKPSYFQNILSLDIKISEDFKSLFIEEAKKFYFNKQAFNDNTQSENLKYIISLLED